MNTASMEVAAIYVLHEQTGIRDAVGRDLIAAGYRVIPSASPRDFFANYVYDAPGCLVLDLGMRGCNEQIRAELADRGLAPPIIYVSGGADVERMLESACGETTDLLLKPVRAEAVTSAIENALSRDAKAKAIQFARVKLAELTACERQVLSLLLKDRRNRTIAEALGIGVEAVKVHRQRLTSKLAMRSVADLVQFAMEAGGYPVSVPPNSEHCGRRTERKKKDVLDVSFSSKKKRRSAIGRADLEKRFMAAAFRELHMLLSREAASRDLAGASVAAQFANAIAPSAWSILEEREIDVESTLQALGTLGQILDEDTLRNFRHAVLRAGMGTAADS